MPYVKENVNGTVALILQFYFCSFFCCCWGFFFVRVVKAVALVFFLLGKWSEVKAAVRPETGGFFQKFIWEVDVSVTSRC